MPPLEIADHYDDVVCWESVGVDAYGQRTVQDPVGLKVRWEPTYQEILSADGARVRIDIVAHTSQDIPIGSIMWEGHIVDLPDSPTDLYEVMGHDTTADLKNRYTNRGVLLRRFRDSLPTIV